MYDFKQINHPTILTHAVLVGLTPLIPIPFLDDWVKTIFTRSMVRQVSAARGVALNNAEVEALVQEDFWEGCVEGCVGIFLRLLREIFSKVFFWVEWRRAFLLVSTTYYTGFLLDAALMDGYSPAGMAAGRAENAARLREAIRRARDGANLALIQRLIRPRDLLAAGWTLIRRALAQLPRMLLALPGALLQGARGAGSFPRRAREAFYLRVQAMLGRETAPEILAVQRLVAQMQATLLRVDPAHFDALHARLRAELTPQPPPAPPTA